MWIAAAFALALGLVQPAAPATAAFDGPGPFASPSAYAQARGAFTPGVLLEWRVETRPLSDGFDAASGGAETRAVQVGDGYAFEPDRRLLIDFAAERRLRPGATADAYVNGSLHAEVRRRLDIYAFLSDMGRAETVELGGEQFDRFWLEAAMGVAAAPAGLAIELRDAGPRFYRDGEPVAEISFNTGPECPAAGLGANASRSAVAWLRHAAPLHPDLYAGLREASAPPCRLRFVVLSPDSPEGRVETWTLAGARTAAAPDMPPAGGVPEAPDARLLPEGYRSGLDAAAASAPLDPAVVYEEIEAALADGQAARAVLLLEAEQLHLGPCPEQSIGGARLACALSGNVRRRAAADPGGSAVIEGLTALENGAAQAAVDALSRAGDPGGMAGAALRARLSEAASRLGPEILQSRPDLDPAALLERAIALDPAAPGLHAMLARRYLAAGAPEAAFAVYDAARAAFGDDAAALAEAAELEARLRAVAPDFYRGKPPDSP